MLNDRRDHKGGKTDVARRANTSCRAVGAWRRHETTCARGAESDRPRRLRRGGGVDLLRVQLKWFDYWLKGINNGVALSRQSRSSSWAKTTGARGTVAAVEGEILSYYLRSGSRANTLNGVGS